MRAGDDSEFLALVILIRAMLDIGFGAIGAGAGLLYVSDLPLWWYPAGFVGGAIIGVGAERLALLLLVVMFQSIAKTHGIKVD